MNKFNNKQKIGIIVAIIVTILVLCYYAYSKEANSNFETSEDMNFIENNTEEETTTTILVHISGAINNEGVYELIEDSRIKDLIDKAGGAKEDAYLNDINLAFRLEDGMKIHIPSLQEKQEAEKNQKEEQIDLTSDYVVVNESKNSKEINNKKQKVNINSATQTELETLPGIGPSIAIKIINYRNEKGKFQSIEKLKEVNGIGESKFNNIKDLITT